MNREPVLPITSRALALIKRWLDQPSAYAEPELLIEDLPTWIAEAEITSIEDRPAIIIELRARNGAISPPITLDPSGFAVLRTLTALGATAIAARQSG